MMRVGVEAGVVVLLQLNDKEWAWLAIVYPDAETKIKFRFNFKNFCKTFLDLVIIK